MDRATLASSTASASARVPGKGSGRSSCHLHDSKPRYTGVSTYPRPIALPPHARARGQRDHAPVFLSGEGSRGQSRKTRQTRAPSVTLDTRGRTVCGSPGDNSPVPPDLNCDWIMVDMFGALTSGFSPNASPEPAAAPPPTPSTPAITCAPSPLVRLVRTSARPGGGAHDRSRVQ